MERFAQKRDANEFTQSQAGGISSLQKAKGVPNQNKSNPGVSGRPLGPPRPVPAPPPTRAKSKPVEPARPQGGGGQEIPMNTKARVAAAGGGVHVPPEKIGENRAENVDGVPGRTKGDDVKPGLGAATPLPPPPPGKEAAAGAEGSPAAPSDGAPIDPATGQPQAPDFDGSFTNEQGQDLNPDGTPVTDEAGVPLTPEQSMAQDIKAETGDTSDFNAQREAAKEKDRIRRAAPSEIPGINTGHFEAVVNEKKFKEMKTGDGMPISEEQQKRLAQNVKQQLAEFGEFPGAQDPDAPPPPIREGGRSFNPFTGGFTGEHGGPNAFKMMGFDIEAAKREFFKKGGGPGGLSNG